ncbi:MAG: adenine phosphoribosyltransferase [Terrimicrobiaceae bacterium]|jgi:adenine phosphoribosyltransferase|nr:adenine phosphoribosyltransferase [Terrimicrobiaceae bacterium]
MDTSTRLREAIRDILDFPKPGILFRDITPLLANPALFREAVNEFANICRGAGAEKIAGIDARGFLFGATVAYEMGLGFVPVRKKGKLPFRTITQSYDLEYGSSEVEIHTDAFQRGEKVALIDDLLATGGTAGAAIKLIDQSGAHVVAAAFLIELVPLGGRKALGDVPVTSIVSYA